MLQKAAKQVVLEQVIPSFKSVKALFEQEYYPNTRRAIGVSETPEGKAYYQSRIDFYTTLNLSPKEIHQKGLGEVMRIKKQKPAFFFTPP